MRRLSLSLDALQVETFATGPEPSSWRGTIRAHCETYSPDCPYLPPVEGGETCGPSCGATCGATCALTCGCPTADPSCNVPCAPTEPLHLCAEIP